MATTIEATCPHCGFLMQAATEHIGREGRCGSCNEIFTITAAGDEGLVRIEQSPRAHRAQAPPRRRLGGPTDVPAWIPGFIAVGVTALLCLLIYNPLGETAVGQLYVGHGFIPPVITFVTVWGLAMLVLKYLAVMRQLSTTQLELQFIPLEIGVQIHDGNVNRFLEHLKKLPQQQRDSFIGERLQGALEHYKSRNSAAEVREYLVTQAEIDASAVDTGYSLLRSFLWVLPILGFIGTVNGIGHAVSGLAETFGSGDPQAAATAPADPPSREAGLEKGLEKVTSNLATAFDTTFLGLVMAVVLLFPTESLRKTERRMLDRIERFANESLLRRLADGSTSTTHSKLPDVVRKSLESAFTEHQQWLAQWQVQVGRLGQSIGADFEKAFDGIRETVAKEQNERLGEIQNMTEYLESFFGKMQQSSQSMQQENEQAQAACQTISQTAAEICGSVKEETSALRDVMTQQQALAERYDMGDIAQQVAESSEAIQRIEATLDEGIDTPPEVQPVSENGRKRSLLPWKR